MQPLTGYSLSPDQIRALIHHADGGVARRSPRFQLLDHGQQPVTTGLESRVGDPADISRLVTGCTIENNTTRAVHRSTALTMRESDTVNFDPLNHLIRTYCDFWSSAGTLLLEVPTGTFRFVLPDRDLYDSGNVWTLGGLDLTSWVDIVFMNPYVVPAGANYVDAVTALLTADYLPLSQGGTGQTPAGLDHAGPAFNSRQIALTPTTLTTPVPIPFAVGDNQLTAVNSLLGAINYYPLWIDSHMLLQAAPMPYYTTSLPASEWNYVTDITSIIQAGVQQRFLNPDQLANIVVVLSENAGSPPISVTKYNLSQTSAISLPSLKLPRIMVVRDDTIPDLATATLRAYVTLQYAALMAENVTFGTFINPLHESHDPIQLNVASRAGRPEVVSSARYPFEEISWTIAWGAGARLQTHTVGRMTAV